MIALLLWLAVQEPSLDQVLGRVQQYFAAFQTRLSGVVAEELYTQDSILLGRAPTTAVNTGRRVLRSDLLLVKPQGSEVWIQFRDVFEVNGKAIRDRSERLMNLFVTPTASTRSQAERIMEESSRFNIGAIERNLNVPVFALAFLLPRQTGRVDYKLSAKARPFLLRDREPADAVVIDFREDSHNTLIRTSNDQDMPSRGRYWVEAESGRILMTELIASNGTLSATIDVVYGEGPGGTLVPVEMREQYEHRVRGTRVDGSATYSHFRQFQVSVDEQLAPIKK